MSRWMFMPLAVFLSLAASTVFGFGSVSMVSRDYTSTQSASPSVYSPFYLSADGRIIVFGSSGTNLVANDVNHLKDIFVYDWREGRRIWDTTHSRWIGSQPLIPEGSTVSQLTPDGRYVVFTSSGTGFVAGVSYPRITRHLGAGGSILYETIASQVYVHDLWSNTTTIASIAPDGRTAGQNDSFRPRLSVDGRFVAFFSRATNLVDLPDTNGDVDLFCRDLLNGTTQVISVRPSNDQTLDQGVAEISDVRMSTNGRYFAFGTAATNVVAGFTDTNHGVLVYWRDRVSEITHLASPTLNGTFPPHGLASLVDLSADGRLVCFGSYLNTLVADVTDTDGGSKVFIRDMVQGQTWMVTRSTNNVAVTGYGARFSGDGRYLLFSSESTEVVPGVIDGNGFGFDYFLHDVETRTNALITVSLNPTQSGGESVGNRLRLSDDGRFVAFMSYATNFVEGTTQRSSRFYVRDMNANRTVDALRLPPEGPGPGFADTMYEISGDGRTLAFFSFTNLDAAIVDANRDVDLFVAPVYPPRFVSFDSPAALAADGLSRETYVLEAAADLMNWIPVNTNITDAVGRLTIGDPQPPSSRSRFYRLRAQ